MLWPAIIAGGALLGSAFIGSQSDRKNRIAGEQANVESNKLQREFAQQGVGWKVADARAAGINPLAALGVTTHSYQPTRAFGGGHKNRYGSAMEKMGQNISSSMLAKSGNIDRKVQSAILREQLTTAKLTNAGIAIKLGRLAKPQGIQTTGDPVADAMNRQGQGNAGNDTVGGDAAIMVKPDEYIPMKQMGISAATNPLRKHSLDEQGRVWSLLREEAGEAIESDDSNRLKMAIHGMNDWLRGKNRDVIPKVPVPKGFELKYSRVMDQWTIIPDKKKRSWGILNPVGRERSFRAPKKMSPARKRLEKRRGRRRW